METEFPNAMPDDDNSPISAKDAKRLFADWKATPAIILAVSGGPDSIALMWLAARWRRTLTNGPRLLAVTGDHGFWTQNPPPGAPRRRGARRKPPGGQLRSAASHAALDRQQAENRAADRGAHRALSFAGASGT